MIRAVLRLVAATALLATTACGTDPAKEEPAMPTKSGTGELRTDLEPLAKRFPLLSGMAEKAEWMSGTLGDDRVPGPSTYWIDAVVTLPAATVAEIGGGAGERGATPSVVEGLRDRLPGGPYLTGDALDDAFSAGKWATTAYLAKEANTVVLVATGQ